MATITQKYLWRVNYSIFKEQTIDNFFNLCYHISASDYIYYRLQVYCTKYLQTIQGKNACNRLQNLLQGE